MRGSRPPGPYPLPPVNVPKLRTHWPLLLAATAVVGALAVRPADSPKRFRLGAQAWVGYAPAYLAREDALWTSAAVSVVELPTDASIVRAMRSGDLEAGCMTLDGAFRVQAAGVEVRLVAVLDYSVGADAVVAAPGAPIATPAELRGKRVAVERHGVGMLFLARALKSAGLSIADVQLVNADLSKHTDLIRAGRVDAVVTYSPHKERHIAAGGRVVCDSSSAAANVIDVLVVRADSFRTNPSAIRSLVRGWEGAATRLAADTPLRAAVARDMGIPLAELVASYAQVRIPTREESRALLAPNDPGLAPAVRETAEALTALAVIDGPVDPARMFATAAETEALR